MKAALYASFDPYPPSMEPQFESLTEATGTLRMARMPTLLPELYIRLQLLFAPSAAAIMALLLSQ